MTYSGETILPGLKNSRIYMCCSETVTQSYSGKGIGTGALILMREWKRQDCYYGVGTCVN